MASEVQRAQLVADSVIPLHFREGILGLRALLEAIAELPRLELGPRGRPALGAGCLEAGSVLGIEGMPELLAELALEATLEGGPRGAAQRLTRVGRAPGEADGQEPK